MAGGGGGGGVGDRLESHVETHSNFFVVVVVFLHVLLFLYGLREGGKLLI